jgi:hypothetical protein
LAAGALSGMILREERARRIATHLLGYVPKTLEPDATKDPWAIVFASTQPVSVTFVDDGFSLTIRGRSYYQGETSHPGMNVTAVYKIAPAEEGFKAIRQGNLQIFPPGFRPGEGRKLSTQQTVIRRLLRQRFEKALSAELLFDGFAPQGNLQRIGAVRPVLMTARDGWLTVALNAERP